MSKIKELWDELKVTLGRLKYHAERVLDQTGDHWRRWLSNPLDGHAYVNLFVESARASPYLIGHVDAILYPTLLVVAIVGWLV